MTKKLPTIQRNEYNCGKCGLCCAYIDDLYWLRSGHTQWAEVTPADEDRLNTGGKHHLVVLNDMDDEVMNFDYANLRMTPPAQGAPSRCVGLKGELGVETSCDAYEHRPEVCRNFEPGSEPCKRQRRTAVRAGVVKWAKPSKKAST